MKSKEILKKNKNELPKLLSDKQTALRDFRFAASGSKTRNVREGRAIRRDIARIKTLLNNK